MALILDQLVDAAITGDYYTANGERVMLPLNALIELGLVDASAAERLKQHLDAWTAANGVSLASREAPLGC